VRRPARTRALHGLLPSRRRRPELRRGDRGRRSGSRSCTIFAENILGGTCARVCPVEVLCQRDCVLVHEGRRPIEIGALQRYATDVGLCQRRPLRERSPANGKRVAVIGAGPAGLAAAGELAGTRLCR
jgi:glutamate synthase (NADPH/NADH) small chain